MTKLAARNVLVVIGTWSLSLTLTVFVAMLFFQLDKKLIFRGDTGNVVMWLWLGLPRMLMAGLAAIALLWVIDARKPLSWVAGLAALYLYTGSLDAWRELRQGWLTSRLTSDYIGIVTKGIMPSLICLLVGIWWMRYCARHRHTNPR